MSYDLYFWPSGFAANPMRLAKSLGADEVDGLAPDRRVLAFREELLKRWPDLTDHLSPRHSDRFVCLTLPNGWKHTIDLPELAAKHGLDCYDSQFDELLSHAPSKVCGWVAEDNLVRLLEEISQRIGYQYDDLDEEALTGALDGTNNELDDAWFWYPLVGAPCLVIYLARSPGSSVVSVRIEGQLDAVLVARFETLLDLL